MTRANANQIQAAIEGQPSVVVRPTDDQSREAHVVRRQTRRANSISPLEVRSQVYRGILGNVSVRKKSNFTKGGDDSHVTRRKAVSEERIIMITPSFAQRGIELRFVSGFGRISRALSTYPVLPSRSPVFRMCIDGDLEGLQAALSNGRVSPFALHESGHSLLHVSKPRSGLRKSLGLLTLHSTLLPALTKICAQYSLS